MEPQDHTLSLFAGIADPALQEAVKRLPIRRYPRAMVIFDQGEESSEVFLIVSGTVEIVHQDAEGELARVAVLQPGELFGEFSYLTGSPRSNAAVAMEATSLLEMPASWLSDLERKFPVVRERITEIYRERVLLNVLSQARLFSSLHSSEIVELARKMQVRQFADDEVLIQEGSTDLNLVIIKRGKVSVSKRHGNEVVKVGEATQGDVLGEMSIITGEPRSATARAEGPVEAMVLPGIDFKAALVRHPKLLETIEDVVRSRAEQTRNALESIVKEIVDDQWSTAQELSGIRVEPLGVHTTYAIGGISVRGQLLLLSRGHWVVEQTPQDPLPQVGDNVPLSLECRRIKGLSELMSETSLPASVASVHGQTVTFNLLDLPEAAALRAKVVTLLARERVRLFVYPMYDVSHLSVECHFETNGKPSTAVAVHSISQTGARIEATGPWEMGEVATVRLLRGSQVLVITKALCLDLDETRREIQFEYETGAERMALESTLRSMAQELGFSRSAVTSSQPPTAIKGRSVVLTRQFGSPSDFLKTYIGSMEVGRLQVETPTPIPSGTPVKIHIVVPGQRGTRRLAFSGSVRDWKAGHVDIALVELSPALREKVEQIVLHLVDDQTEESWQKRRRALIASKPTPRPTPPREKRRSLLWILIPGLLAVAGLALTYLLK